MAHLLFCNLTKPNKKSKRATKPTDQDTATMEDEHHDRKEGQHLTAVWRNGGCSASYDSLVVGSSAVLRLNFCAKNPPLRKAEKRCRLFNRSI